MKIFLLYLALILQLSQQITTQLCNSYGCDDNNNNPPTTNPCSPNPCLNSGLCGSSTGSNFKCICAPNFTGIRCEVSVVQLPTTPSINNNFCSIRPCMNGGSCININQQNVNPPYACVCPSTMTGPRCEIPVQPIYQPTTRQVNPCSVNPCASGSTCFQTTQSPYPNCVCPPNRTGPTCNQFVTQAPPTYNPCNSNNPCSPVITTPFNPCQTNPCGSGQCLNNGFNNYRCQCPPNLTGNNCNQQITTTTPFNPCALNPCQQGQCVNQGFSYTCRCPNGFSGQRCEIRNPCVDNPCRNSGTCVPGSNSYYCICTPLFTGSRCEIYAVVTTTQTPNPCQPNPCQYGGQCINHQPQQFECSCRPQYTGSTCQKRLQQPVIEGYLNSLPSKNYQPNPCSASPCSFGSTCININQPNVNPPYACVCPPNRTGPRCDQPVNVQNNFNPCQNNNCNPTTQNPCLNNNCNPTTQNPCINNNCNPVTPNPCLNNNCNPVTPNPCLNNNCNPITLPPQTIRPTTPYNPCNNNPCNSGSTCRPTSAQGYQCQCASGYTGSRCEQVDMCTSNSCYNGGTCQTQRTGQDQYTVSCICPINYTGSRCQTPIQVTTTRQTAPPCQCLNNGQCQPNGGCSCPSNFYGQNCQYYTTTKQPCQCLNNGICQPTGVCQCQNNYFGNNCQYRSNTLLPSTSFNSNCPAGLCVQGTCAVIPQGGASYCVCNFGWTGPRCNIRNYCQSNNVPCKNGGTCINGQNDYYCVCNSQTTGQYCELAIQSQKKFLPNASSFETQRCPVNFCLNGGVCEMKNNIPVCTCKTGFFGPRCHRAY